MPKYLIKANYTAEGMKGLQEDKASGREKAVAAACKGVGGKLDAIYYALGDDDAFVVVDLPSHVTRASLCVAVSASGLVNTRTVPLLTVAEMDKHLARERNTALPAIKRQHSARLRFHVAGHRPFRPACPLSS